jgi:RTX calcium-binding nonapeptide repeat (4 copies)
VELDPLGQPTDDQGDLRPADRLPLPVHGAGRGRSRAGRTTVVARLVLGAVAGAAIFAGVAGAATITGTARADVLRGTQRPDFLDGLGGRDRILARGGNDRVRAQDGLRDTIACGAGHDLVNADRLDATARDCEVVARQISRDTYRDPLAQHESQVEPDTFAFGATVVSVFQTGRIINGGASNTGFSTSLDGGRTWSSGFMPGLTRNSAPPGPHERASDPVIAYDARHRTWLASSLLFSPAAGGAIVVNRSPDGLRWDPPVTVTESARSDLELDKQWLACDNGSTSPFFGNCYMAYSDFRVGRMSVQTSRDGGLTWSGPIGAPDNAGRASMLGRFAPAPQPVVRPDGALVIVFNDETRMAAIRSLDGGQTLTSTTPIAPIDFAFDGRLRDPPLPSAEIAGDGTVYTVWPNCADAGCSRIDLVLSSSADGVGWTPATPIPTGGAARNVLPGLAVDPASSGPAVRLALVYYAVSAPGLNVRFVSSTNGGASWTAPQLLSTQTMAMEWLPVTTQGAMVGDYVSTSFVGGNAVPVFAIASRPARFLNQAMFAAVLPVR